MKCDKCDGHLVSLPCPDGRSGCQVAHFCCPKCRAKPCDVCGKPRQPEAENGICPDCAKAAVLWAARRAHAEATKPDRDV